MWEPGRSGKGFLDPDGTLHTWPVDEDGSPHHMEVAQDLGIDQSALDKVFGIMPSGAIQSQDMNNGLRRDPEYENQVAQMHPGLHTSLGPSGQEPGWLADENFAYSSWHFAGNQLNWEPGMEGKGLLLRNGEAHHWPTEYGDPIHEEYAEQNGLVPAGIDSYDYLYDHADSYYIDPYGHTFNANGGQVDPKFLQADPRLTTNPTSPSWLWDDGGLDHDDFSYSSFRFSDELNHQLNWEPGNLGKSLITNDGEVHTWNIDPQTESPHHFDYAEDKDLSRGDGVLDLAATGYINPDGTLKYLEPELEQNQDLFSSKDEVAQAHSQVDPRLKPMPNAPAWADDNYNYSSFKFSDELNHQLNWSPGDGYGKALLTNDGELHTWGDENTHHFNYAEQNGLSPLDFLNRKMLIYPDGAVYSPYENSIYRRYDLENAAAQIDPRLYSPSDYNHYVGEEENPYYQGEPYEDPEWANDDYSYSSWKFAEWDEDEENEYEEPKEPEWQWDHLNQNWTRDDFLEKKKASFPDPLDELKQWIGYGQQEPEGFQFSDAPENYSQPVSEPQELGLVSRAKNWFKRLRSPKSWREPCPIHGQDEPDPNCPYCELYPGAHMGDDEEPNHNVLGPADNPHVPDVVPGIEHMSMLSDEARDAYIEHTGEPYLYHRTRDDNFASIADAGLVPWDDPLLDPYSSPYYGDTFQTRPGHVYLGSEDHIGRQYGQPNVRVNLNKLDPMKLKGDEDHFYNASFNTVHVTDPEEANYFRDMGQLEEKYEVPGTGRVRTADYFGLGPSPVDDALPDDPEELHDNLGEWANDHDLSDPEMVQHSLNKGTLTHEGSIPPEAIELYSSLHGGWIPATQTPPQTFSSTSASLTNETWNLDDPNQKQDHQSEALGRRSLRGQSPTRISESSLRLSTSAEWQDYGSSLNGQKDLRATRSLTSFAPSRPNADCPECEGFNPDCKVCGGAYNALTSPDPNAQAHEFSPGGAYGPGAMDHEKGDLPGWELGNNSYSSSTNEWIFA